MTYRKIIIIAAVMGMMAVILGAFGAHALAERLADKQLSSFKTGVTYHFYHTLLLLLIGIMYKLWPARKLRLAAWACITGVICFSGSLYILACRELIGLENTAFIGPITPIGGLFFVLACALVLLNFISVKNE